MTVPLVELMAKNSYSRYRVYENAAKTPGKCGVCGAHDKPVLDFGIQIPNYGWVMVCFECVAEAGVRIGLVRPEVHEAEVLQVGQSVTDYLETHGLKVVSNELYNAISVASADYNADIIVRPSGLPSVLDDEATAPVQRKFGLVVADNDSNDSESSDNTKPFDF